ncbi:MAG: PD-(D/E)XK nuclease family protein [Verrucomicrobiales bacterium]
MNTDLISLPVPTTETPSTESDPLEYISASRLKCFQTCRLQWYFRYVEQLPTETSPALLVGKVVHSVLQAWNMARWRSDDFSPEQMKRVFQSEWVKSCEEEEVVWKEPGQEDKEHSKGWNILEHYFENTPIPLNEKPEAVEVRVERDLDAHGLPPLLGFIDLVRQGGRITDFKTSARSPSSSLSVQHQNEVQLGVYALLYREGTGQHESGFEIHTMIKTVTPKLVVTPMAPMEPDQIRRLIRQMESYVSGVMAEDFVPSPGQHCSWCDYFGECRKWKGGASC